MQLGLPGFNADPAMEEISDMLLKRKQKKTKTDDNGRSN